MHLKKLKLINFKNYKERQFEFSDKINAIIGLNGVGKTNLVDAIHYLCLTKSFFSNTEIENINYSESLFSIKGNFVKEEKENAVICSYQKSEKKIVQLDRKPYKKISDHIGQFPLVFISPNDTDLIRQGGTLRRRFFDNIISQQNKPYFEALIEYQKVLKNRNTILKNHLIIRKIDFDLLKIYTDQLIEKAEKISKERKGYVEKIQNQVKDTYLNFTSTEEQPNIEYETKKGSFGSWKELINASQEKDLHTGRSNVGIHKDDFTFFLNQKEIKKFGSQGQQKSFIIALKLGVLQHWIMSNTTKPILILDDIFDRLDDTRISKLLILIEKLSLQVFLTDARVERTKHILKPINANFIEL